jgi:beta-glucanase (GH16 family)
MRHFLLFVLLAAAAHSRDSVLVWQDEFDLPGQPDPTRWDWDEGGSGMGNNEAQYYTKNRPANARVEDGQLVITARREDTLTCWYGPCKFTSARLVTRGRASWLYGRVDVRAKLPKGKGVWPAIWMLAESSPYGGWPGSGEIDIMEHVGYEPRKIYGTVHTQAYNHKIGTSSGSSTTVTDPAANWHTYSLEWGPDSLFIGVDGDWYHRFGNEGNWQAWPFDQPFHLILNLAVGGEWGGVQGVDTTIFPQEFRIDWVRVHKLDRGDGPYTLIPRATGSGTIALSPSKRSYAGLDTVVATATPAPGWEFVRWTRMATGTQPTVRFLVDHSDTVGALFLPQGERIANGDFSQGLAGWSAWNDASVPTTITVTDGQACIKVAKAGEADWMSQLDWPGLRLVKGEVWELTYRATATAARPLVANLVMDHTPHAGLSTARTANLPAGPSTQTHRFTVSATDSVARLEFDFATDTTSFCLDDVSLRRVSTGLAVRPRAIRTQPSTATDAAGRKLSDEARGAFTVKLGQERRTGEIQAR